LCATLTISAGETPTAREVPRAAASKSFIFIVWDDLIFPVVAHSRTATNSTHDPRWPLQSRESGMVSLYRTEIDEASAISCASHRRTTTLPPERGVRRRRAVAALWRAAKAEGPAAARPSA